MAGRETPRSDRAQGRERVVISTPEVLIASIPAMLGFPPLPGSVVMVCGRTATGGQGPVIRVDVPGLTGADADPPEDEFRPGTGGALVRARRGEVGSGIDDGPARWLARYCEREGVRSVHLVVVGEDCPEGAVGGVRAGDAAEAFAFWLGEAGVEVEAAYGVGGFAENAPWVDLFGMVRGVQLDPGSTQIAAVHAFQGWVGAGSREEIESMYAVRDPDACDVDSRKEPPGPESGTREEARASMVARHEDVAGRLAAGDGVDDDELAVIGRALLEIGVRDTLYRRLALRLPGDGDGQQLVWWAVARRRPPRERSVALLLLGASSYFSGQGVHAWCALTAAREADRTNSMAALLLQSLEGGIAPERLRQVAAAA